MLVSLVQYERLRVMFLSLLWFIFALMFSYHAFEEYKKGNRPTAMFWVYLMLVAASVSYMLGDKVC